MSTKITNAAYSRPVVRTVQGAKSKKPAIGASKRRPTARLPAKPRSTPKVNHSPTPKPPCTKCVYAARARPLQHTAPAKSYTAPTRWYASSASARDPLGLNGTSIGSYYGGRGTGTASDPLGLGGTSIGSYYGDRSGTVQDPLGLGRTSIGTSSSSRRQSGVIQCALEGVAKKVGAKVGPAVAVALVRAAVPAVSKLADAASCRLDEYIQGGC